MKCNNKKHKDNLSRPFEKPETENQKRLHKQIQDLFKQEYAIELTYPELFDVLERVKLSHQIALCSRMGLIKIIKPKHNKVKVKQ